VKIQLPKDLDKLKIGMRVTVSGEPHNFATFTVDEIDIKGQKIISHGKYKNFIWAYFHEKHPLEMEIVQ
jgi:hypothetical protein